jgi:hypothetical protein
MRLETRFFSGLSSVFNASIIPLIVLILSDIGNVYYGILALPEKPRKVTTIMALSALVYVIGFVLYGSSQFGMTRELVLLCIIFYLTISQFILAIWYIKDTKEEQ